MMSGHDRCRFAGVGLALPLLLGWAWNVGAGEASAPTSVGPVEPAPLETRTTPPSRLHPGWLQITDRRDNQERAWVEGHVIGDDKLVIDTHNVAQFDLDISRLQLNWSTQIVLRLDGHTSQLTRKPGPIKTFLLSRAGAWHVVDRN
jgi:hypothetical protein